MLIIEKNRKTKTAVVCPIDKTQTKFFSSDFGLQKLEEAKGLVVAMGQAIVFADIVKLGQINSATYFGKGTVNRFREIFLENEAELLVVDAALSPVQQRNLEKELNIKVIDRTAVILEIFGQRAQTKEGKLQVELAHLSYQRGRLVRSWTHLERQRGGGGFLGGPGETQIELDRRHIDERIIKIKKSLEKVQQTRSIQRTARDKVPFLQVALVGYTNAGKSTLFNKITKANVLAKDMLFATLDPTMRKVSLNKGTEIIVSDTVGFISNLPHELVMAFRATLEEVLEANLIVHVIDVSNPNYKEQREDVLNVLHELGLEKIEHTERYIEVYNKIDLIKGENSLSKSEAKRIMISAVTGQGIAELLKQIEVILRKKSAVKTVRIPIDDGKALAEIYRSAEILERYEDEQYVYLRVHC